jgi:hypothetical protein
MKQKEFKPKFDNEVFSPRSEYEVKTGLSKVTLDMKEMKE